jgi:Ca2+-binding RTX toxin-like protein
MTMYLVTSNSVGPGLQFSFVASGDSVTILPGVTVGSTFSSAISFNSYDDTRVSVLGTLMSALQLHVNGNTHFFQIGTGGTVISDEYRAAHAAISFDTALTSSDGRFVNAGFLSALRAMGIHAAEDCILRGENWGTIVAAAPVVIHAGQFVNGGTISANDYRDAFLGTGYHNGVVVSGGGTRVENLEGGVITAVGNEGAGVRFGTVLTPFVASSEFVNAGEVTSVDWWGVDYGEASASSLTLVNSGVIRGDEGAFRGHPGTDTVYNSGLMVGPVSLGGGDDRFQNIGGTVMGFLSCGDGSDLYEGRGTGVVTFTVFGSAGNDTLRGARADDWFDGGADNDSLQGGAGDDTLDGGFGNDTLHGGADDDKLTGGDGNDRIAGGRGADTLAGGAGRDTLAGGADDDELQGGGAADVLTGGSGRDVFIFASVADIGLAPAARDRITDFRPGEDLIDLSAIDANTTAAGNQAFTFITGAFTGVAGQLRYGAASGLLQGDVNGDGTADFALELAAGLALSAADIVL